MDRSIEPPYTTTQDLPPYRGILAVDARGFTDRPGSVHQTISGLIPKLVGLAFANVGLADVWDDPAFFGPTGDGFAVGVPTRVVPRLVHPFLDELQQVVATHNHAVRVTETRLQLRVSLNIGPLPAAPPVYLGGNGTARNDTHRLLDSTPVRAILAAASPQVTFVAAILSDRVYQDVIAQGYAGRHPDHFVEVAATVEGKGFTQRAWLHLPEPSGNLLLLNGFGGETGAVDTETNPSGAPPGAPGGVRTFNRVQHNDGQVAGVVRGGMHQRRVGQ